MVRGAALRDDQRQRALEGLGLAAGGRAQVHLLHQPVGLAEVFAVPYPQRIADAVDLAETHARGQRHRVEVVDHDAFARTPRIRPVQIGAKRGRRHLSEFLGDGLRSALRRMPVFFDLGGQRAAARGFIGLVDQPDGLVHHRVRQPLPIERRVHVRILGVEQPLVLNEQQRADQRRRHRGKVLVLPLRVALKHQCQAVAVTQGEAGLVLLAVRGKNALVHQPGQLGRHTRLFSRHVAVPAEPLREGRQALVAQACVVRAGMREANAVASAWLDLEPQLPGEAAEVVRLPLRIAHFTGDEAVNDIPACTKGGRQASENPATW